MTSEGASIRASKEPERQNRATTFALCAFSLALSFVSGWLLNYAAFPLFDSVYWQTREVSAIVGGCVLGVVAVAAYWRPRTFTASTLLTAVMASMAMGAVALFLGVALNLSVVLVVGAVLVTVGAKLANIVVGVGCIVLGMRQLGIAVTLSYLVAYVSRGLFMQLPELVNLVLFCVVPAVAALVAIPFARPLLSQSYDEGSPAQMAATAPSSFLPFGHQVFVTLLLFRFIYGYTLAFGEVDRVPILAPLAVVPFGLALGYLVLRRRADLPPDGFFRLSILCATAGFLLLAVMPSEDALISFLLACGTGFFEILMCFVLVALGKRNTLSALSVLAWGNAMASWGTLLGANFGRLADAMPANPWVTTSSAAAVIVFGIMVYVVLVQRQFSFASTLQALEVPEAVRPVTSAESASTVAERCAIIGRDRGLTDREQEVFEYLARGRNVRFIQNELVVSCNTVRTHVSHIYAKLDVHSHQELIDLVEDFEI